MHVSGKIIAIFFIPIFVNNAACTVRCRKYLHVGNLANLSNKVGHSILEFLIFNYTICGIDILFLSIIKHSLTIQTFSCSVFTV